MCILFMYVGKDDVNSDYNLILASNRDEFYDRPALNMGPWAEDPNVIGGRDLEAGCDGGTWLALSPLRRKIGVLLNLPKVKKPDAKSRGKIVADFVKSEKCTNDYIDSIRDYVNECNEFVLVTVEFGCNVDIQTYTNATDEITSWKGQYLGFGNNIPEEPLMKVQAGTHRLEEICTNFNKFHLKNDLINELTEFLKSSKRHLPDPQLEKRQPHMYEQLSSVFVAVPEGRYGTRTHTILLVTKTGHIDVIETTLQAPIDLSNPQWKRSEYQFEIPMNPVINSPL